MLETYVYALGAWKNALVEARQQRHDSEVLLVPVPPERGKTEENRLPIWARARSAH